MFKTLIGLAALALACVSSAQTIAVINGEEVKSSDYYHRMEHLNGVYSQYSGRLLEVPPGLIALDRIITERLTIQLAASHGVSPKPAEVDAAYADRLASNPTMEKDAALMGLTVDDLRYGVEVDLARFKLVSEGIIVTDQEVEDEHKANIALYSSPRLVDIRYIVVSTNTDQAAVNADLAAGKDFGDVAKARSIDVSKLQGGLQKDASFDHLDFAIREALNAIKIGGTTDWIPVPGQPQNSPLREKILYVTTNKPEPFKYTDTLREAIRRKVMVDRGSIRNDVTKELNDMLQKAKIDIKDPAFAKAWEDLRQRVSQGQKATKSGG